MANQHDHTGNADGFSMAWHGASDHDPHMLSPKDAENYQAIMMRRQTNDIFEENEGEDSDEDYFVAQRHKRMLMRTETMRVRLGLPDPLKEEDEEIDEDEMQDDLSKDGDTSSDPDLGIEYEKDTSGSYGHLKQAKSSGKIGTSSHAVDREIAAALHGESDEDAREDDAFGEGGGLERGAHGIMGSMSSIEKLRLRSVKRPSK
jgi:hypothetical protein